ncbi:MAG: hypothetical protein M3Z41_07615 [Candidatus Eremiobacteraeota bacterium]|nr:hypothetical protein [Candidatus Eremiobacteraeota bacterium]
MLAETKPVQQETQTAVALRTLGRRLVVHSDSPEVVRYVRSAYRRVCMPLPKASDELGDTGCILANNGAEWLVFNGQPVEYPDEKPKTLFRLAFYGSSKLIRLSFRQNSEWHSLYAAALRLGDKAIVISAPSGIGKTTLALELMSRGAGFFSDEFVFVRKSDSMVSGLPRGLVIRERTLSLFRDARLRAVCRASAPRMPHGDPVWDTIDPGDIFGEHIFAQSAPLAAAIVLERGVGARADVAQIPAGVAAADFTKRVNTDIAAFDRFANTAAMLAGTSCYRVAAASPQSAADAIEALLR